MTTTHPADDPPGDVPEDFDDELQPFEPPAVGDELRRIVKEQYDQHIAAELGQVPRPINWRTLPPEDLEHELLELNSWVDWLRHEYGLPPQIVPPMWHRHPELLWELSALKQHWLFSFDPQAKGNQALAWHHDFAIARERLRDWVTISGTRLDRDRPTRITPWPGGETENWIERDTEERPVTDRREDFLEYVVNAVRARAKEQADMIRGLIDDELSEQR